MQLEPIYIASDGSVSPADDMNSDGKEVTLLEIRYDDNGWQHVIIPTDLPAVVFAQAVARHHGDTRRMAKIIF